MFFFKNPNTTKKNNRKSKMQSIKKVLEEKTKKNPFNGMNKFAYELIFLNILRFMFSDVLNLFSENSQYLSSKFHFP